MNIDKILNRHGCYAEECLLIVPNEETCMNVSNDIVTNDIKVDRDLP